MTAVELRNSAQQFSSFPASRETFAPSGTSAVVLVIRAWNIIEYYRILQNITEYYRILQNITEYYRILQNITEYYRILQNITEYYRILQNITEYYRILQNITDNRILQITEYYRILQNITEYIYLCFRSLCLMMCPLIAAQLSVIFYRL